MFFFLLIRLKSRFKKLSMFVTQAYKVTALYIKKTFLIPYHFYLWIYFKVIFYFSPIGFFKMKSTRLIRARLDLSLSIYLISKPPSFSLQNCFLFFFWRQFTATLCICEFMQKIVKNFDLIKFFLYFISYCSTAGSLLKSRSHIDFYIFSSFLYSLMQR